MTNPASHPDIPDPAEHAARNAALLDHGTEPGFWDDDQGRPAPWPDDIDEWIPPPAKLSHGWESVKVRVNRQ